MRLYAFIVRRLVLLVFVLWGVVTFLFLSSFILPVDPAAAYAGPLATKQVVDQLRIQLGLNLPVYVQYFNYMKSLLMGNLGYSYINQHTVVSLVSDYYPATIELALYSLLISLVIGIPLGIVSAMRRNKPVDHASRIVALSGVSIPIFWLGLLLLLVFYHYLGFAGLGRLPPTVSPPPTVTGLYTIDSLIALNPHLFLLSLEFLILPALTLGYAVSANISRITRASMIDVLSSEYITAARAKGLSERVVIYRHALKNALIPTVTVVGTQFGYLLAGTVITENIFGYSGLGRLLYQAIIERDVPVISGATLVIALNFVLINLVIDLLYTVLNPRIHYG